MGTENFVLKTETEHRLYKYLLEEQEKRHLQQKVLHQEQEERQKLQNLIKELHQHIAGLEQKIKTIEQSNQKPQPKDPTNNLPPPVQFETDEEELANETEWIRKQNRKKRKLNQSLSPPNQKGETSSEEGKNDTIKLPPKTKKSPQPPPIVVENIKEYQKFYDLIISATPEDSFLIKMRTGDSVKINAKHEESYRAITKVLLQNNFLWHSYENKQDRPIRVMAKNLHHSCEPSRIVEDLKSKGFYIQEAVNKLSWRNKEPLSMFMLSFNKDENIKKIYEIKSILGCKVDIQPLKISKLIPQCKRCQAYGHTQKYCNKEPRCVKCTKKHLTKDCTKPAETKPKCVHCGESHPASYRGCMVAKQLQALKNKTFKKVTVPQTHGPTLNQPNKIVNSQPVTENLSFAQVTQGATKPQAQPQAKVTQSLDEKINKILNFMSSFDERLKKLECSANKATTKQK